MPGERDTFGTGRGRLCWAGGSDSPDRVDSLGRDRAVCRFVGLACARSSDGVGLYRVFQKTLSNSLWRDYVHDCRGRDPEMPIWSESTIRRLRSSVFQILTEAGYIDSTKARKLQTVHIVRPVIRYLEKHDEQYVLRCLQVGT